MRIESLKGYQKRDRRGRFEDLPLHLRVRAEAHFKRLCDRWRGRLPAWRRAILCGQARRLAVHPPDSAWGKRMLAKRAGYARQRRARAMGVHPTRKATLVRVSRQRAKKQGNLPGPLNSAMERRSSSKTPPWLDPLQVRLQREAEAAWLDKYLAHQEQVRRRRG